MKVLFIKLKNIGDAMLLTPTIKAVKQRYPEAETWVWVRSGTEGILHGCQEIDHLLLSSPPGAKHRGLGSVFQDISNLATLRQEKLDLVFDLSESSRGRSLALASGARFRACASTDLIPAPWPALFDLCRPRHMCASHRVLHDYNLAREVLDLPEQAPPLQFARERADFKFVDQHGLGGCVVIHPATRWKRKMWPVDRWAVICRRLAESGCRLVLSAGPVPEELAMCREIQQAAGVPMLLTDGCLDWSGMAGLMMAARLFVGVDTAAMHLAAACQTPLVALFGPSVEIAWRPWQCRHELVLPQMAEKEFTRPDGRLDVRLRKTDCIEVSDVWDACQRLLGGHA